MALDSDLDRASASVCAGDTRGADNEEKGQGDGNTTISNPLIAARDRLHASARELLQSLEETLVNHTQSQGQSAPKDSTWSTPIINTPSSLQPFELALRSLFRSCTTGADQNTVAEVTDGPGEPARRQHRRRSTSTDVCDRTRITSTLTGHAHHVSPVKHGQGDHIYAQLFFDDQIRAAKAINGGIDTETPVSQQHRIGPSRNHEMHRFVATVSHPSGTRRFPSQSTQTTELSISRNGTFDDCISAISAHTLEALAMAEESNRRDEPPQATVAAPPSTFRTSVPFDPSVHTNLNRKKVDTVHPSVLGATQSPFFVNKATLKDQVEQKPMKRSPSSNSRTSSKWSRNTHTTASSSFEQWQSEDTNYWVREVAAEEEEKETFNLDVNHSKILNKKHQNLALSRQRLNGQGQCSTSVPSFERRKMERISSSKTNTARKQASLCSQSVPNERLKQPIFADDDGHWKQKSRQGKWNARTGAELTEI